MQPHRHPTVTGQLDLFGTVIATYLDGKAHSNDDLYEQLVAAGAVSGQELGEKRPVGRAAAPVNVTKRRVRWFQQSLKAQGVIERVPEQRGTWRIASRDKNDLTRVPPSVVMLGFSTGLGAAMWGSCTDVFGSLQESIAVCITSPPYPLRQPRAYGNPCEKEWVEWICRCLEPVVKRLLPGGSIALNVSNDIFDAGSPSRSQLLERLSLAMSDYLGLSLMDRVVWNNPSKAPAPIQWASKRRVQLNTGYEPVYVFCNDPLKSFADNRRVLQPHTEKHKRLIAAGGERRARVNSDGAYRIRPGAYGNSTEGRIPKNVLTFGHSCADQRRMRKLAKAQGLPVHGASMPLALAIFLVQWLSRPDDLVVDPFGGTITTGKACEMHGRRWMAAEIYAEYLMQGRLRFEPGALDAGPWDLAVAA